MKRKLFVFLMLCGALILTGCGKPDNLKSLSYSAFQKKIESKETFIVEVMSDDCTACKNFEPKIEEVVKEYNITVYQLNIHTMSDEDYQKFASDFSITGTPTTMFITNGEEQSVAHRIDGNVSKDKIISKMKAMGYISE